MKVIVKVFLALSVVTGVISGCATKSDINELKDRVDQLESYKIQTVSGQITAINNSLTSLQNTDTELKTYIETLNNQAKSLEDASKNLEDAIKKMKDEISSSEADALAKMEDMKAGIDGELSTIKAAIEALQAKDDDLQNQINDLKNYISDELKSAKDWAEATSATLEEYNKTAKIVADIQTRIESLESEIAADIDTALTEAIAKSEASMKEWINEQLTGYYTVAQMDSKLEILEQTLAAQKDELKNLIEKNEDAIETINGEIEKNKADIEAINGDIEKYKGEIEKNKKAIEDLEASIKTNTDEISSLKSAIEESKEEITEAYKNYIAEAIKDDGVIGKAIQAKIDDVNDDIESLAASVKTCEDDIATIKSDIKSIKSDIITIQSDLTAIKADIESLKTDIKNTLRNLASISYIPAYSDHIERVEYEGLESYSVKNAEAKDLTLRFDVYPATSAASIAIAFEKDATILSARAVYTRTRANAGDFASLKIKSATANEGVLSVVIPAPELGNEFILGKLSSSLILRVDTGTNLIQSEYIPLTPEAEGLAYTQYMVGSFDTSGDGSLDADEIGAVKSLDFRNLTDLSSLDLTSFTNLTEVICPSLDWLLGLNLSYNNTVTFYSPAGKKLISDHDVLIDGVIWQKYNVGATESNIEGDKFTFAEAQRACPSGYRTPTIDEYKSLVTNYEWKDDYSYMDGEHYGYLFCGSREYSSDAPAVFLPPMTTSYGAAVANYWTSSKNTDNFSFYLYFEAEGRPDATHAQKNSNTVSVRCVKE